MSYIIDFCLITNDKSLGYGKCRAIWHDQLLVLFCCQIEGHRAVNETVVIIGVLVLPAIRYSDNVGKRHYIAGIAVDGVLHGNRFCLARIGKGNASVHLGNLGKCVRFTCLC